MLHDGLSQGSVPWAPVPPLRGLCDVPSAKATQYCGKAATCAWSPELLLRGHQLAVCVLPRPHHGSVKETWQNQMALFLGLSAYVLCGLLIVVGMPSLGKPR